MSSVIVAGAIIGGVIGGGSSVYGVGKSNRNQIQAFKKQMEAVMMNYNYNQNYANKQSRALYDSAVSNLFTLELNTLQNNAAVENALGEAGYDGRTKEQSLRTISGQVLRQKTAAKDAYEVEETNIRSSKDNLYIQTKTNVENATYKLDKSLSKGMQSFMTIVDGAAKGAAIGAATAGAGSAFGSAATSTSALSAGEAASGIGLSAEEAAMQSATISATSSAGSGAGAVASGVGAYSTPYSTFSFSKGLEGFNTWYTQYGQMYQGLYKSVDSIGKTANSRRYYGGYYY